MFTNFLIALACTAVIAVLGLLERVAAGAGPTLAIVQAMMVYGIRINLLLIAFNLIPIPPLDGSHVVKHLLPAPLAVRYQQLGGFGLLILIALLAFGSRLLDAWFYPAVVVLGYLLSWVRPYILPSVPQWLS